MKSAIMGPGTRLSEAIADGDHSSRNILIFNARSFEWGRGERPSGENRHTYILKH